MFTWVCPKCGREVPPAYTDCPDCSVKTANAAAVPSSPVELPAPQYAPAPPPVQHTPPPSQYAPPQAQYAPPQPQYAPPQPQYATPQYPPPQPQYAPQQPEYTPAHAQYAPPQPQYAQAPTQYPPPQSQYAPPQQQSYYAPPVPGGLPTWAMTALFALGFVVVGAGIYWIVGTRQPSGVTGGPSATVESPAAKAGAKTNPYQKYVEVAGVRFIENPRKKPEVRFVVINHSPAELEGLSGNVTIWGRTQKSEEDAAGTFTFNTRLGPWETKDLSAPLVTKHKIYELPDWQNVSTDIQITAPGASGGSAAPQ